MDSKSTTVILLSVFSFANLLYILWFWHSPTSTGIDPQEKDFSYRGHDYPEHLPLSLENVAVMIEETRHYRPLGVESDEAWFSAVPAGFGYVRLGPGDRTFVITMFHELHCLRMINLAFSKAPNTTLDHVKHCLNYMRQSMLCSPDLALEPGNFEERDFEVERTSGTHMCKNWDAIYTFMDQHYYSWNNRRAGYVDRTLTRER